MGQSTDAILCFGVCVASETIEHWEERPEHEDDAAEKRDIEKNPLGFVAFMGNNETIGGVKVGLVRHQSANCPEYIVAIAASETRAWRGYPKTIKSLDVKPGWAKAIRAFCKKYGVETEKGDTEPKWWIASDWS